MVIRQRRRDGSVHDVDCGPRPHDVFGTAYGRGVGGALVVGIPGSERVRYRQERNAEAVRRYRARKAGMA